MTSKERHEARYQRRVAKRKAKIEQLNKEHGNFDKIISFDGLCESYRLCKKSVSWKESTQKYERDLFKNIYNTRRDLYAGKNICKGFHCFTLRERGKIRHIRSVHISERVVQKAVNKDCLIPILQKSLIYDNGASVKNKGIKFTEKRLIKHLREFYKEYGTDGYILLIDFSKYFDNILHEPLFEELDRKILDPRVKALVESFITPFGDKSLGLGSETSQILAINYCNGFDHFIKEKLGIKYYARYMDDSYLIHHDKKYLQYCLDELVKFCEPLGIQINLKKTQIVKLTHQFAFLKTRYHYTENGKVIRKVNKAAVTRVRRKLKKMFKKYNEGVVTLEDIRPLLASFKGYVKRKNGYHAWQNVKKLYHDLFNKAIMSEALARMEKAQGWTV